MNTEEVTNMIPIQKLPRAAVRTLAAVVTVITCVVVVNATQTITTPNAAFVTYSLAAGANSAPMTPIASRGVFVIGVNTTVGYRGVGQVSLLHIPGSFIEWTGLESTAGSAITQGYSGTAGTHILYLDYSHTVDIEVDSPDTIRIHNGGSVAHTGNVTFIW